MDIPVSSHFRCRGKGFYNKVVNNGFHTNLVRIDLAEITGWNYTYAYYS